MQARTRALGLLAILLSGLIGCGVPRVTLPSGAGDPFAESSQAYAEAAQECTAATPMSASLAVSGRAGDTKIPSMRIDAGFAQPSQVRLEGYPRITFGGKPVFVLVARGEEATLVLTREGRVLRGAPPAAVIEALAGIALAPAELRAVLAGCGLGPVQPANGRSYPNGWAALDAGAAVIFLRQVEGRWRIAGVRRGALTIEYSDFGAGPPSTVRLRTAAGQGTSAGELTVRVSQLEMNATLDNAVFDADVPADAVPLTLDELRKAGPLGGARGRS